MFRRDLHTPGAIPVRIDTDRRGPLRFLVFQNEVHCDGKEDYESLDCLLVVYGDTDDRHTVVHDTHNKGPEKCADYRTGSTGNGCSTDKTRRDRIQFETGTRFWGTSVESSGKHDARDRRENTEVHVGQKYQFSCIDS